MSTKHTNISSSSKKTGKRILIAAGGTGGHVYPAIAIADECIANWPDSEILFVGTRDNMEWQAVPKAGYNITDIWVSGFQRQFTKKNLLFPLKLIVSLLQCIRIVAVFKPDLVITCGGYVSGPVGWIAAIFNKPLFLQEQNSYPGVTNRMLSNKAALIFTAFEDAANHFPAEKVKNVGNPVRSTLDNKTKEQALAAYQFKPEKPVLLILGGSGGALSINRALAKHYKTLHDELDLQIIWQCGPKYYDEFSQIVEKEELPQLIIRAFINDMDEAYAAADLVVSRAGALSCTELMITGTPSILVPSPNVAADHQTKNARSMVDKKAAILLPDKDVLGTLSEAVSELIFDAAKIEQMAVNARQMARPEAAQSIVSHIITYLNHTN